MKEAEIRAWLADEPECSYEWLCNSSRCPRHSRERAAARSLLAALDEERAVAERLRVAGDERRAEWRDALALVCDDRDRLRAQLAALREAVMTLEWGTAARACSDLAASAREHETRIRAKALREAADVCEREATDCSTATGSYIAGRCEAKLRALADEAERGTR